MTTQSKRRSCPFDLPAHYGDFSHADHLHNYAAVLADDYAQVPADVLQLVRNARIIRDTIAEKVVTEAVQRARDAGKTWEQIGEALNMTRQAAHLRYAEKVR